MQQLGNHKRKVRKLLGDKPNGHSNHRSKYKRVVGDSNTSTSNRVPLLKYSSSLQEQHCT
jgi:hypothetical protein